MLAAIRHFVRLFIAITSTKFQLSMYSQLLAPFPGPAQLSVVRARGETGNEAMQLQVILLVEKLTVAPPRSSTEHVFSFGDKMKTGTAKVGR